MASFLFTTGVQEVTFGPAIVHTGIPNDSEEENHTPHGRASAMASGIPSDWKEENYPAVVLDARRCIQVHFDIPVSQERLRGYFSDGNLSGGGDITWLWVCKDLALIEFESERAAKGVLNQPGHITENITFYVSEPDWIEHRTVEILGVEPSACEEILDRRGLQKFVENIQMSGDQSTMVTFTDKRVVKSLLSDPTSIPEGVKVCPYDRESVDLFPCRVLVRTKDDDSLQTVFDALHLHIECRKIDIFKDVKGGTYLMQSAKLTDRVALERVVQPEIGNFSVSAVFVINCDQMSSSIVGEAHFEAPDASVIGPSEEADRAVDTEILKQYDELKNKYEESTARGNRLEHQVKQLTESERNLQIRLATLTATNEEVMRQKKDLEERIEVLKQDARTAQYLREKINCQERHLVEKTKQILKLKESDRLRARLEALQAIPGMISRLEELQSMSGMNSQLEPLQAIPEMISRLEELQSMSGMNSQLEPLQAIPGMISRLEELQSMSGMNSQLEPLQAIPEMISQLERLPEIISRLEPLQAIPRMISSQSEEIHSHITDTADKLSDNLNNVSSQIVEKIDALRNTWTSFLDEGTSDDTAKRSESTGPGSIPSWLKYHAEHLSCTVGPNWLDVGRALDLNGDQLEVIWVKWGQYGMRELTLQVIECWCRHSTDQQISLDALQSAMSRLEINPLMVEPMGEDDQRILTENYQLLVEDMMDVTHIESYLRQAKILSASAVEYIIYPGPRYERILRLLKVLPFSGSRALGEFRNALLKSEQTHIAMALAGEQSLPKAIERDVIQDARVRCLETKNTEDRTYSEQLTTIMRACAEIKQGVYMHREELEKCVFLGRKAKGANSSSLLGDITSEETAVKEVG